MLSQDDMLIAFNKGFALRFHYLDPREYDELKTFIKRLQQERVAYRQVADLNDHAVLIVPEEKK